MHTPLYLSCCFELCIEKASSAGGSYSACKCAQMLRWANQL